MPRETSSFKGNKQFLPSKPCAACGRPMTWRKRWAKNWDEVKFCSDACRRRGRVGFAFRSQVELSARFAGTQDRAAADPALPPCTVDPVGE
jgi:hypothetical protein